MNTNFLLQERSLFQVCWTVKRQDNAVRIQSGLCEVPSWFEDRRCEDLTNKYSVYKKVVRRIETLNT